MDVGGTNTDAVVMRGSNLLGQAKITTSENIGSGVREAISAALADAGVRAGAIDAVMIGTTQFTNALVEGRRLSRVGVMRLAAPAGRGLLPLTGWPRMLAEAVNGDVALARGGYNFDGRAISPLDESEIRTIARRFDAKGLRHIAVTSVFAPVNDDMERRAAEIVAKAIPGASVTAGSTIGRLGLLERENAAIINAALIALAEQVVDAYVSALAALGIDAPLYLSQNDGTLMTADAVRALPVLTFAAGQTNSMRGAAGLTGHRNAIVVDIGGTTTDVGVLRHGIPRESSVAAEVGGIRTNFRMPDVLSFGLGGGSVVVEEGGTLRVGPESVGHELTRRALVFGGDTLTATDIAVASGHAMVGEPRHVAALDRRLVAEANETIHRMIEEAIDRMKTSAEPVPVVLVGGGSILLGRPLAGASGVDTPTAAPVANAIGAASAQAGGEVDRVCAYEPLGREHALAQAREEARQKAIVAGAEPDAVEIVDVDEIPLAYLPGNAVRVRVKAIGPLARIVRGATPCA